jgi:tRNA-Thr(GGU) m(6)t(6)A37 methyltransferase TsaA
MKFEIQSIGTVYNKRKEAVDDFWGDTISEIRLHDSIPESSLDGIESFSHIEVLFVFDKVTDPVVYGSVHPRGNTNWPKVGIFVQRKKNRPNLMGATICEIVKREGRSLWVKLLDAIDETPVIDIKPVWQGFLPLKSITEPAWSKELMEDYWK